MQPLDVLTLLKWLRDQAKCLTYLGRLCYQSTPPFELDNKGIKNKGKTKEKGPNSSIVLVYICIEQGAWTVITYFGEHPPTDS